MKRREPAPIRSQTPKGRAAHARILIAAERLFAARGFHGTSLRDVAAEAGVPLAVVVYHVRKKAKLYGAVLDAIAVELAEHLSLPLPRAAPPKLFAARLDALLVALVAWAELESGRARLLLREVTDNAARVTTASRLPLAPLLAELSAFIAHGVRAGVLASGDHADDAPEVLVLHVLGALSYFVVARPTLRRIVGARRQREITASYPLAFVAFARRALGITSGGTHGPGH